MSASAFEPQGKPVRASQSEMTEVVLPNDANPLGNLLGGKVMHWMDMCGAIAAHRHCGSYVVTASFDYVEFLNPVRVGELIILKASVNRVFRTSLEVGVKVFSENVLTGTRLHTSSAYITFVALDEYGRRKEISPVTPETDEERRRYEQAGVRRQHRLFLRQRHGKLA
ncbi:MAG TPA: acyl-CoA thioesterase [Terriglobales bacterium]|nr:acyl-CoA thioesterase [Terriglobales bacterium]